MTFEKLDYLMMVAEERNITKAARRLYISQPTLTNFINNLEKNLGFKLFDRSTTPVKITTEGKAYIQKMHQLLLEEQHLIESLQKNSLAKNEFRVGIGQVNSEISMPGLVERMLKKHPFLNITIHENPEKRILEDLKKDRIDLMFGHISLDTVNFVFEEITEQKMCLLIPENLLDPYTFYPENRRAEVNTYDIADKISPNNSQDDPVQIDPEILYNMPIIEPDTSQALYINLRNLASSYPIHPIRVLRTANMITATTMLQMGLGYMYTSPDLLTLTRNPNSKKIIYCKLPKMKISRKYYAIYKEDNPNKEYIKESIGIMKEIMKKYH